MGIFRVAKNSNYVVMNRTALNDNRLSWKAKGIMAYMLSMPDDWVFYMDELMTHSTDGKASFRAGFNELKECGYIERKPIREGQRIKVTTDTKHAQKLYEFFVSRLQKFPSDKLRGDIDYYLATYQDADLIIEAFERALINSKVTNKEKYVTGTLRNWKHEGVHLSNY
ncbi:DnaD domain protein [Lysinibacillus xylanilyticus]|uniref:DnaD domain protein n=2 Tax=Lysinibacillus xylanilyticus TaxID=582475 RepID=UPI003D046AE9